MDKFFIDKNIDLNLFMLSYGMLIGLIFRLVLRG